MSKIKRNKFIVVLAALLMLCGIVDAQYRKELSLHSGGVLSSMQYGVGSGSHRPGFGGHLGIGYRRFFTENFGIGTGFELSLYNAVFKSDAFNYTEWSNDGNYPFEFRSMGSTREKQTAMMMQIPLMLHFQGKFDEKRYCIYGAFGLRLGVPLFGTYKIRADYRNSGYYPYEDYTYTEQRFRGFGKYSEETGRGGLGLNPKISIPLSEDSTFDLPFAASMSAEVGVKWKIRIRKSRQFTNLIYTGLYLDYGLNSLKSMDEERYDQPVDPNYANNQFNLNANSIFPSHVTPFSAGIRVHLTHGYGTVREPPIKQKKIVLKKRTITVRQTCDCCRICLLKKKPGRCQDSNRIMKHVYRYR